MARTPDEVFERTREIAAAGGLTMMTTEWRGAMVHYLFRCRNGHEFERLAASLLYKNSTTCLECEHNDLRERWMGIVKQRGGELVEGEFRGVNLRYKLRCAEGHEWIAFGSSIAAGSWCRYCAAEAQSERRLDQDGLRRLQDAAQKMAGRCLSTEYVGTHGTYEMECAKSHRWSTKGGSILRGSWCPHCARKQSGDLMRKADGLEELQAMAAARGGACLSDSYIGRLARYRFRCTAGHEWESFAGSILNGSWCTACRFEAGDQVALQKLRDVAAMLGWRCLADRWDGYQTGYKFECEHGHRFERHAAVLLYSNKKTRCDMCEEARIEARWLATIESKHGTLLDGPFRGLSKRYRFRCARGHDWETTGEAIRKGAWCPECGREKSAQCNILSDGLERLQGIARARGGKCLAAEYTLSRDYYPFECAKGHRWKALGQMVMAGNWCPTCAAIARRLTLESMQRIARERGGECLSTEYLGTHVKLTWQCHRGHVWDATPANVKYRERWCPNCAILSRTKNRKKRLKWDFEGAA